MTTDLNDLVVFEMANNHQGSVDHGLKIINEMAKIARRHRVRAAVKLQYRHLETLIHPAYSSSTDIHHIPRFFETRLDWADFHTLVAATRDAGMKSIVTPFDEPSVEMALNHGVDILKVASCSSMDWPLQESISRAQRPVICSTGGCELRDTDRIVTFYEHRDVRDVAILHCVGMYPTADEDQQLNFMRRMMIRYPHCTVGYSGHEAPENLRVTVAAVAMGARILERHVGVPTRTTPLNKYSMNPDQVDRWVSEVVRVRQICGHPKGNKRVKQEELESLGKLKRGAFAKRPIQKGESLSPEAVFFAMPLQAEQTTATEYSPEMVATRDYSESDAIYERRALSPVLIARGVVHEAKGLLREAGIPTGNEFSIELSHHYGIESFRRYGAVMVNFVNREYCKKLIVLLPGQEHPTHKHLKKEETFQILFGEMKLELDGEVRTMRPGEMQLIQRGERHSFSTTSGCVFEEISTTHLKDDSEYEDPDISSLDPIQRKTVIDEW